MEAKNLKLSRYRQEMVLILDFLLLVSISLILYLLFGNQIGMNNQAPWYLIAHICLMVVCGAGSQIIYRTYDSLWRYAQSKEYLMLLLGGVTGYFLYLIVELLLPGTYEQSLYSLSVYALYLLGMLMIRLCYRQYRLSRSIKRVSNQIHVAIIGAGEAGVKLVEELQSNPHSHYYPVCIIDDSEEKIGKRIHNIEIKGPIKYLKEILTQENVREIVIAIPSISTKRQMEILEECAKLKCKVQILPDNLAFMCSNPEETLWSKVREIRLEELLGRDCVNLDSCEINHFLYRKVILVTGGGGSIGSELCRQIANAKPKKLIILDIYENNAYDIQQELIRRYNNSFKLQVEIASIRDQDKIDKIFEKYKPQIVFHAAAHKHVPLMEDCPDEAIRNNIFGTYNLVMAAVKHRVERFVLVSTDKAVNPTNIMGASKRYCEMILQSMKDTSKTEFVAVRFGNVLGSNGSVIPLFQKQIAEGGPVTITDKRIVRFFMTITEAVQLVLEAGAMANKSEIYVLDMGKPVKILDLAENLIRLSGYVPYNDIKIVETGLRPGEKLYEELLTKSDELIATANNKIFIENQNNVTREEVEDGLEQLRTVLETGSSLDIRDTLKRIVPTYRDSKEVNVIVNEKYE